MFSGPTRGLIQYSAYHNVSLHYITDCGYKDLANEKFGDGL